MIFRVTFFFSFILSLFSVRVGYSAQPAVRVVNGLPSAVEIEFELGNIETEERQTEAGDFQWIHVEGMSAMTQPGLPALPQRAYFVRIPENVQVRLQVVVLEEEIHRLGRPLPAQPIPDRNAAAVDFQCNTDFYAQGSAYPEAYARLGQTAFVRGVRVVPVIVTPVRFFPQDSTCHVAVRLRARLFFDAETPSANMQTAAPALLSDDALLYSISILNPPDNYEQRDSTGKLIVVCVDGFIPVVETFVEWKRTIGIPVELLPLSTVGETASEVREYLQVIYDSQQHPPQAILLIGDVHLLPAFYGVEGSLTDHPYSTLAGDDYLPDVPIGRIPCRDVESCRRWVERTVAYEQNPTTDDSWAESAVVLSSSEFHDPENGLIAAALLERAGFSYVTQLQQPETNALPFFIEPVSAGCSWLFYIGHGYAEGLSSISPAFTITELPELYAQWKSPFIISVACATADLDWPGMSLGESWLSLPSDLGTVAYFGATENTAFFYSDTIGLGTMRGFLEHGLLTIGQAVNFGKLYMSAAFPENPGGRAEETMQQFILLGDPTLSVLTETPQDLMVACPVQLPLSAPILLIAVERGGYPCAEARFCLRAENSDYTAAGFTDENGQASIALDFENPTRLTLAVTARNSRPHFSEIELTPDSGAYVVASGFVVRDSYGDGDGFADRGEEVSLALQLINYGNQVSLPGAFALQSTDSFLFVDTMHATFISIAPGETLETSQDVWALVSDSAPDEHEVFLSTEIVLQEQSAQEIYLPLRLHAPVLQLSPVTIEEDSGDGDGRPEAGEILRLRVGWKNGGSDDARNITARINIENDYVIVRDSIFEVSRCAAGDTLHSDFTLLASASTPRGYPLCFKWNLSGENIDSTEGRECERINQIPVLIYERDPTPANVDGFAAAVEALGVELERWTVLPEDLPRFESIFVFLGIFPNNEPLSAEDGARLTAYLNDGGALYLEGGDTWAFDTPTQVHPYFHIEGVTDGSGNTGPIAGEPGTNYEDMHFSYQGENNYIDHLAPQQGAMTLLQNDRGTSRFPVCIAYDNGNYRTIGSSIELGSLADALAPSSRIHLMANFLEWFGVKFGQDITGPVITHTPLEDAQNHTGPFTIEAELQDVSGIGGATLVYHASMSSEETVSMLQQGQVWHAAIPEQRPRTRISYHIETWDEIVPPNRTVSRQWRFRAGESHALFLSENFDEKSLLPQGWNVDRNDERSVFSIRNYGERLGVLEIGDSPDTMISVVTAPFDASRCGNLSLCFWHYLRGSQSGETQAIVMGSTDGGRTFPHAVWEMWARTTGILDEDFVSVPLMWATGQTQVALQFSYQGDFYWRLDDISVEEIDSPESFFISGVCIYFAEGAIHLVWPRAAEASYYVVYAGSNFEDIETWNPVATTSDTTFSENPANYSRRFYRVEARFDSASASNKPEQTTSVQIRPEDLRWMHKLERAR